ncbi:glycerol-3-phosphate responsive antiterminator GlpP [Oceanobacillus arenosus]|uniref:Glycerol uptake operon antiterminator regulatory protein n=1 Tax=Oceanobacillus arenosus TaxID=1229153 RepID=A0A3D8PKD3_9BACI|nr:glycerol-3-phosphate responsive antiterminator [Oceanobacillus arenosus]RDW16546.1 glycerol-3-phosphate responsive antiterminator GlpP [Oceanobacillus arenosus]
MDVPKGVIPAIRSMKNFDRALETKHETIIFLETRLGQLKSMVDYAKRANKKVLIHFDLIQGLKADEYGMEFLIHEIKPDGILSTRANVISLAKKHKLLAIQRMFLLDSLALDHNLKLIERSRPDCIEVLPGLMPSMIEQIYENTKLPLIAGGLITTEEDVRNALDAGAIAISTSKKDLWDLL